MAGLADTLRERTLTLHRKAERSGVVRSIVRQQVDVFGYALFLRNLLPAYVQLERGLERNRRSPGVSAVAMREVYRSAAIESDLNGLCNGAWRRLPLLPAGEQYANRVATASRGGGTCLIAHAYTRYLGDLNGGQVLRRLLANSLGLDRRTLSFYAFPGIADLDDFKMEYRDAINRAGLDIADCKAVVDEARAGFQLNIKLSEAVEKQAAEREQTASSMTEHGQH